MSVKKNCGRTGTSATPIVVSSERFFAQPFRNHCDVVGCTKLLIRDLYAKSKMPSYTCVCSKIAAVQPSSDYMTSSPGLQNRHPEYRLAKQHVSMMISYGDHAGSYSTSLIRPPSSFSSLRMFLSESCFVLWSIRVQTPLVAGDVSIRRGRQLERNHLAYILSAGGGN